MIDKILGLWVNLTPWTKRIIILCLAGVIIAAMVTGNFDELCNLFGNDK